MFEDVVLGEGSNATDAELGVMMVLREALYGAAFLSWFSDSHLDIAGRLLDRSEVGVCVVRPFAPSLSSQGPTTTRTPSTSTITVIRIIYT